jgi:hypothetical protein
MDSNEPNDLYHNGAASVTEGAPGAQDNEHLDIEDDEDDRRGGEGGEPARKGKSRRLVGGILILLILVAAGAGLWVISNSRKTKIRIPVRDNARKTDQSTARGNDDSNSVTAQAIESVRIAIATPTPAASGSLIPPSGVKGTTVTSNTPVTDVTGAGNILRSPTNDTAAEQSGASSGAGASRRNEIAFQRNPERSIRCAPTPTPVPLRKSIRGETATQPMLEPAALKRVLDPGVVLPPFGAFLPVRTLGAIFTLRQSIARFELTRDVRGQGWEMKKGTIIVGQQQGSEQDRAYINLTGFIDPVSGKLVKLNGDFLGPDGAPGIKGKRHKVSSTWKRVLDRAVTSGVALGQAALSRGNSTTIVLPGAVAPELTALTSTSRREFVEVPAATPAYLLITRLPEQAPGVDTPQAAAGMAENPTSASNNNGDKPLSDEEVARLMISGSPEEIRAAMPRMSPELRQLAETVLKETNK